MENVRGGSGPAKRLTAATPTVKATRTGSAINTARNARRSTLFIGRYGLGGDAGVYGTLVSPAGTRSLVYSPRPHIPQDGHVKIIVFDDFNLCVLRGHAVVELSNPVRH